MGFSSLASAANNGPTVVLASTSATTTSAASIPVTATFSAPVVGFSAAHVAASGATVSGFSGSGATYSFNLIPSAGSTVTVQVNADMANATDVSALGNQPSNVLTFMPNTSAPAISNVTVTPTSDSTATVNWNTDSPANGQVVYGFTSSYDASSSFSSAMDTLHVGYLGGLLPTQMYHYAVISANGNGTTTSPDLTFTTGSTTTASSTPAVVTPLAMTGVDSMNATATADGTFASGWKWILHFTVPDTETSFHLKFGGFSNSSHTIPAASNIRYYSAQSTNAAAQSSAVTASNTDYGAAMTLTGDTSTTTPGRQIDVVIEAAVPSGTPTGAYTTTFGARSE
jgi:hypothetical protein